MWKMASSTSPTQCQMGHMSKSEGMSVTQKRNTPGVEKGVALGTVHAAYDFGGPSAYTVQCILPCEDPVLVYSDGTTGYLYPLLMPAYMSEPCRLPSPRAKPGFRSSLSLRT